MAVRTLIQNQTITTLVTSGVLGITGGLVDATVTFNLTVPFGALIDFNIESSSDGSTWAAKDSYRIDNRTGTKTTSFHRLAVIPNELGLQMRARVTEIVGSVTIVSITITN
jgi:hypothetical protein